MWLVDDAAQSSGLAPPVIVSGLTVCGVGLQDWVYILTIVYLVFQIGKFILNAVTKWRSKNG